MKRFFYLIACFLSNITLVISQNADCTYDTPPHLQGTYYQQTIQVPDINTRAINPNFRVYSVREADIKMIRRFDGFEIDPTGGIFQYNWMTSPDGIRWRYVKRSCEPYLKINGQNKGYVQLQVWFYDFEDRIGAFPANYPTVSVTTEKQFSFIVKGSQKH